MGANSICRLYEQQCSLLFFDRCAGNQFREVQKEDEEKEEFLFAALMLTFFRPQKS